MWMWPPPPAPRRPLQPIRFLTRPPLPAPSPLCQAARAQACHGRDPASAARALPRHPRGPLVHPEPSPGAALRAAGLRALTYFRENCYSLPATYDPTNLPQAFAKAVEIDGTKLPLGIFYQIQKPTAESEFPQLATKPLVDTLATVRSTSDLFNKLR